MPHPTGIKMLQAIKAVSDLRLRVMPWIMNDLLEWRKECTTIGEWTILSNLIACMDRNERERDAEKFLAHPPNPSL